ncbi:MAG: glutamate--tRNA ligase [archaeon]
MEKLDNFKNKIYAYAIENATSYGKAREDKVLGRLFKEGLKKEQIKEIMPLIKESVKQVNSLNKEKLESELEKIKDLLVKPEKKDKELAPLPDAVKGKIVLRLAPFPSGDLHIGNAKTYLLNAIYGEAYKGKTIFVFDDTIGSDAKGLHKDAYNLIQESFKWLGVKYDKKIIYKSSRLKTYYKYAEELIKKGKAYVCSCPQAELRENRAKGVECSCRQFPVSEQKKRWKKMFKAKQGDFTLRIKTDMQNPNPAFRDRVIFRISDKEHPRVGKKYRVWPMLEFSWAVDDHLLKITHIIRGKDLMIETEMEKYIWEIFKWKSPVIIHTGLVQLEGVGAKISKSKAQKEVESGKFMGWDDPRTWSIHSLKNRGIFAESIREFVESIGLNENDIIVPVDSLYAINRKKLDPVVYRYYFVPDPIEIKLNKELGKIGISSVDIKVHPEKEETRTVKISKIFISREDFEKFKGQEIRLMHLFNIKLGKKIEKDGKLEAKFKGTDRKDIQKIQWVSEGVNAKILMPEGNWVEGLAESGISILKSEDIIQFERVGFCKLNNKDRNEFWFGHR